MPRLDHTHDSRHERAATTGIANAFALLRLLPGSDHDKDAEILALCHQLAVLQRQVDGQRVRFDPADRAWLAALLRRLPKPTLYTLRLLVRPVACGVGSGRFGRSTSFGLASPRQRVTEP